MQALNAVWLLSLSVCVRADTAICNQNGCDIPNLFLGYAINANGNDIECADFDNGQYTRENEACQRLHIYNPNSLRCDADGMYEEDGVCYGVTVGFDPVSPIPDLFDVSCSGEFSCARSAIHAENRAEVVCSGAYSCVYAQITCGEFTGQCKSLEVVFSGGEYTGYGAEVSCTEVGAAYTVRCSDNSCGNVKVMVTTETRNSVTIECEDEEQFCPTVTIAGYGARSVHFQSEGGSISNVTGPGTVAIPTVFVWVVVAALVVLCAVNFVYAMMHNNAMQK